ncbi:Eae-like protein [Citrobacter koseri]|uniref:Eae-like protein n=1 Tax=Citrobacter koseri TaxID=545 RepID=UPI00388F638A
MKSTVETKIIELVKSGHELAKELHCAESAALVSDLATQLEVQFARSNVLAAKLSMINDLMDAAEQANKLAQEATEKLVQERDALAAENAGLISSSECLLHEASEVYRAYNKTQLPDGDLVDEQCLQEVYDAINATPTTDSFLAEVQSKAREEGAYFVANRMLAAWDAGFIDDTASNAADIARMILTSTEFMADAPEGDFDRSFADGVLKDIAAQLRKGAAQ